MMLYWSRARWRLRLTTLITTPVSVPWVESFSLRMARCKKPAASSGDTESAKGLIALHQERFVTKWRDVLAKHLSKDSANVQRGRFAAMLGGLRIIYLDDQIPHCRLGSHFPRGNAIIRQLEHDG